MIKAQRNRENVRRKSEIRIFSLFAELMREFLVQVYSLLPSTSRSSVMLPAPRRVVTSVSDPQPPKPLPRLLSTLSASPSVQITCQSPPSRQSPFFLSLTHAASRLSEHQSQSPQGGTASTLATRSSLCAERRTLAKFGQGDGCNYSRPASLAAKEAECVGDEARAHETRVQDTESPECNPSPCLFC